MLVDGKVLIATCPLCMGVVEKDALEAEHPSHDCLEKPEPGDSGD